MKLPGQGEEPKVAGHSTDGVGAARAHAGGGLAEPIADVNVAGVRRGFVTLRIAIAL